MRPARILVAVLACAPIVRAQEPVPLLLGAATPLTSMPAGQINLLPGTSLEATPVASPAGTALFRPMHETALQVPAVNSHFLSLTVGDSWNSLTNLSTESSSSSSSLNIGPTLSLFVFEEESVDMRASMEAVLNWSTLTSPSQSFDTLNLPIDSAAIGSPTPVGSPMP